MEIYDLFGNDGLASGIYRCRAARGGLNFKICSVWLDTRCAAAEILSRICRRGAVMGGRALALYAQLWRLGGVSDADGFAALAAVAAMRGSGGTFDIQSAMIEF